MFMSRRSPVARVLAAGVLAAGIGAGTALAAASPASAALPNFFIAAPNGMVGVPETIVIKAPRSVRGQVVTIGLQNGAFATTMQTTINQSGFGAVTWTPTAAGSWTINGLGSIASVGSESLTVAPMPTYTVLLAQNHVQQGVTNNLLAGVVAPIGTIAPAGSVYLASAGGNGITTVPLSGSFGTNTATATLPWNPSSSGDLPVVATYQPSSGGQLASTSGIAQPNSTTAVQPVAMRWPTTLYVGTPTVLQAVLGAGYPDGSVAFLLNGAGLSPSIPTTNGVATFSWTPNAAGVQTITVSYTGIGQNSAGQPITFSGSSQQTVNIQPAKAQDNITVDPPGQPAWSIAAPVFLKAGSSVTLAATSTSGTTVLFSEQGPCVISGAVLTALSAGQCQVTAISPGTASLTPGNETYTITIS